MATAISFIRTIIAYVLVVFALRVMGKRQVGELQPSELVVAIMISDLAAIPLSDSALPLSSGVIPILTLIVTEIISSLLSLKLPAVRRLLTGSPAVIIKNGVIQRKEMRKNRYNLEDLAEALRMKDYFDMGDVHTAILETNGSLSVLPKSDKRALDAQDLKLPEKQQTLPHVIIADGKLYTEHMKEAGVDIAWVEKQVKKKKTGEYRDIFLLTVDGQGKVTIQRKDEDK